MLSRLRERWEKSFFARPWQNNRVRRVFWILLSFIVLTSILSANLWPQGYDLEVGQVSPRDIPAPKTIINREKTRQLQEEAEKAVPDVYDLDPNITKAVEQELELIFQTIKDVRVLEEEMPLDQRVEKLQSKTPMTYTSQALYTALSADEKSLEGIFNDTKTIIKEAMQVGIRDTALDKAQIQIRSAIYALNYNNNLKDLAAQTAVGVLRPNMVLNEELTEKLKKEAVRAVEPERILKGEFIVRQGERITESHIALLKELGLQGSQINFTVILGLAFLVIIFLGIIIIYLRKYKPIIYRNEKYLTLVSLIFILTLLLSKVGIVFSGYLVPVAAGSMLITILLDSRLAILMTVIMSFLAGIMGGNDFWIAAVALVGGIVGVYSVSKLAKRSDLTRAGFITGFVNVCSIAAVGLITHTFPLQVLKDGGIGIINGVISAILTIGLLPYFETTFGITTSVKLLELSNPNETLLRRLLVEAPGTYHHSIIVGNLAEAAAEVVGGDTLLARVGAYYHDIGKLKRPYFFIENQFGNENPHDRISPTLSTLIITSHTKDGVELAKEYKLPDSIIDIIRQHHGNSLLTYFYHRAATENERQENINEDDFRHSGPKPQTKEAAVVMLADSVEAAVRSLGKPNPGRIEGMVRKIIKEKLHDGQLDECNLTLKDLDLIAQQFVKVLTGIFHSRIEYPENIAKEVKEIEGRKVQNGSVNQ